MNDIPLKIKKTLSHHAKRSLVSLRGTYWQWCGPAVDRPVFVLGCSRAGTTLVYKTFSLAKELGSIQRETHEFWAALHPPESRNWDSHAIPVEHACETDRNRVQKYFFAQTGKHRFVDKNNQNGLSIAYLIKLFPDAHFVFIKRSPGDNISSLIEGWRRYHEYGAWAANLPAKVAVDEGAYTRWCFFLAQGWRNYLHSSIQEVCAFQYTAMNHAILEGKALVPVKQWTELCYEQVIKEPVAEFNAAFSQAGLAYTPALRQHCSQVIATPYNAFSEVKANKWKQGPHAEKIRQILPMVKPIAERLGYPKPECTC